MDEYILETYRKLEMRADISRYILELVCTMMDKRLSEGTRMKAAEELLEREDLYNSLLDVKEIFRSIANRRTDMESKL